MDFTPREIKAIQTGDEYEEVAAAAFETIRQVEPKRKSYGWLGSETFTWCLRYPTGEY